MGGQKRRFDCAALCGIGPEIAAAAMDVLTAANGAFGLGLTLDYDDVGFTRALQDTVLEQAKI